MKKIKVIIFVAAIIIGLLFAKAFGTVLGVNLPGIKFFSYIKGSGIVKTEKRDLAPFKQIDVSGAIEVEITSQKEFNVDVQTDDNLLEYVRTEVSGDTLKIYTKGFLKRQNPVKVFISLPELTGAEVSGASKITANNIKTETLTLDLSGASKILVNGEAANLNIDASGASKIDAENLQVANADIDLSGATRVVVNATEELKADASGASKILYVGQPKNIFKDTSGAAKVSQK